MELGLAGGGLAVGMAELGSGDLAGGWAEVVAEVEDIVAAVALVAVAREEAGTEATAVGKLWAGEEEAVLAAMGAWAWLWLLQGGMELDPMYVPGWPQCPLGWQWQQW